MKIELKSIQIFDRMSEETTAFHATLYINGKKVGYAKNDGRGGCTTYQADHHDYLPLIKEAESYCESLPPLVVKPVEPGDEPYKIQMNLENFIDDIIEKELEVKEIKRLDALRKKHQLKALVIGNEREFRSLSWPVKGTKRTWLIADLLRNEVGRKALKEAIQKEKLKMSPTERILNTNIPEELL